MLNMEATLATLPAPVPDRDSLVRDLVGRLGDGGTTDHARAAVAWAIDTFVPIIVERVVADLRGVNEVAGLLSTSRAQVLRWANQQGRTDFPAPVLQLACGPHWSATTMRQWGHQSDQDHGTETS
jgi:hypothetical protein